ncbi:phosphotransferase enzyme family protein [Anatilimnocola sp. NA78]|uniref:phosphotransferase enzyme family protein n=1 Tax=Anatilimnocola sp. NA78 TaxID=3415683 RepID=UPI003CE52FBC
MNGTSPGSQLDPSLLQLLVEPYGLAAADLRWIRSSQNCVYEHAGDPPAIVRISHGRGRTLEQVEAEIAWVAELAAQGLPVCQAILSPAGRMCERVIHNGQEFLVVRFQRAPGRKVELADSDAAVYRQLGQLTGRLHEASFARVSDVSTRYHRPRWFDSRLLTADLERYAAGQPAFQKWVYGLIAQLAGQTRDALGLVHADIHFGNLFLHDGQLWIFDFDNCEYGSVEQDLATMLYDAIYCRVLNRVPPAEVNTHVRSRWQSFLGGYRTVRRDHAFDEELLRKFLVLREAIIYLHYHRVLDLNSVSRAFLAGLDQMRRNVEQETTEIELAETS